MRTILSKHLSTWCAVVFGIALVLAVTATQAIAFPQTQNAWQARYGAVSPSGDNARCQLCHANANGGSSWNAYGWDILLSLADATCDLNGDGTVSNDEAFFCIEPVDSDGDSGTNVNLTEIGVGTQPGWTLGPNNTLFTRVGTIPNQPPPGDIGSIDPDGTEPLPPELPPPPGRVGPSGPPRLLQLVKPGQSIQAAIDRAKRGGWIFVFPGVYRELGDPTNGLNITKSLHLIGLSTKRKRVVFKNAGNQRNGIVVVPPDRTACMSCHASIAPPFELLPGVQPGLKMREPMIHGFMIQGFTIDGFENNGLFTENVDGFKIIDVESVDNKNYGIFPTLSKNGLVTHSRATGSDDSGFWVETSENVLVTHNLAEGNVTGFEVSNSDDVLLIHNETRNNTVGMAVLLLPDLFDDRPGATRIDLRANWIHDNNKPNTARPGSILSFVPSGTGILHLGVDDSMIQRNWIEGNKFTGIAIVDYCLSVLGTPFDCTLDPSITPEFLADQDARNNRVVENILVNNGTNPDPHPFAFAAADLTLLSADLSAGNCYADNIFTTFFSLFGFLPPCP